MKVYNIFFALISIAIIMSCKSEKSPTNADDSDIVALSSSSLLKVSSSENISSSLASISTISSSSTLDVSSSENNSSSLVSSSSISSSSFATSSSANSSSTSQTTGTSGTFTDTRDGQLYRYVSIGTQVWMAENLNFDAGSGSYCYDDTESNCDTYGRLYEWERAIDICPTGWHLPSDAEWTELSDYVISNSSGTSTDNIGPYLKSTSGWNSSGNGTDDYGFSGLPGGWLLSSGSYHYVGYKGLWWSSTEVGSAYAYHRLLSYSYDDFFRSNYLKSDAYSVRCIQDTP